MIDLALDNSVIIDNAFDAYIQEIDILFNTTNTELIGYTDYGTNFQYFLFELNPNVSEVKDYVSKKLAETYYYQLFLTEVNAEIIDGTEEKIYLILISIKPSEDEEPIKKTYIYK